VRLSRFPLLVVLLGLALLAPAASATGANAVHPFLHTIKGGYEDACGVAFDGSDMWVSDYYHDQIVGPSSTIESEDPSSGPCKLAFDAAGNLYVNNWHHDIVRFGRFKIPGGPGEVIDPTQATGLALDRATGNLFVAHLTYISEYEAPVQAGDSPVATIGLGHLGEAYGLAVSDYPATAGDLYVADAADNRVKVFENPASGPTTPVGEIDGVNTPQGRFSYLVDGELAIDNSPVSPSYGHLYVLDAIGHGLSDHPEAVLDEFNSEGLYRDQISGFTDAEPSGIAIKPDTGEVYVTSGNSEESLLFVYGPTAPAFTLMAARSGTGDGTVLAQPTGIVCGAHCAAEYNQEERITLVALPDLHSDFTGWTVEGPGAEPCPGTSTCTLLLFGDTEVTANFEGAPLKNLNVSVSGAGTVTSEPAAIQCPGGCSEEIAEGRPIVLTATPAPQNRFAGWSGPDCDESTQTTCEVTMSTAKLVSATFEPISQLSLGLTVTGTGQGTVTSYPGGIYCPGACSAGFDQGSTVYLMAAPSPGSDFGGFSGGGCSGTATLCAVPVSSAQDVTASFTGIGAGPSSFAGAAATALASLFDVSTLRTLAHTAILRVDTDQEGVLVASGGGAVLLKRHLLGGPSTVRIKLDRRARLRLRHRGRLSLRLSLGFVPNGSTAPAARTLRLHFTTAAAKLAARSSSSHR
jgi:DNA-binding beta-propeller fold protein YncE